MATKTTTPPKTTKLALTGQLALTAFQTWAATHPGLTSQQLIKGFTEAYLISQQDLATIKASLNPPKPTPAPTPAPKPAPAPTPKTPTVAPQLIIQRTPYPKWWKDSLTARIQLTGPGSQVLATVTGKLRLYVATIVITVTGETEITITFGTSGTSGPLYLGGTGQPMGIVIAMGNSPAPCARGPLTISATGSQMVHPSVGGFATCFIEAETT